MAFAEAAQVRGNLPSTLNCCQVHQRAEILELTKDIRPLWVHTLHTQSSSSNVPQKVEWTFIIASPDKRLYREISWSAYLFNQEWQGPT